MTALIYLEREDCCHLISDGLAAGPHGSHLAAKVIPLPHLDAAVGFRGPFKYAYAFLPFLMAVGDTFDRVADQLGNALVSFHREYAPAMASTGTPDLEVVFAGISETLGPCAWYVSTTGIAGQLAPFQTGRCGPFAPLPGSHGIAEAMAERYPQGFDEIDPLVDGPALIDIQARQLNPTGPFAQIGGFVQVTTVRHGRVEAEALTNKKACPRN